MGLLLFLNIVLLNLRLSNHFFKIKKDALKLGESPACNLQINSGKKNGKWGFKLEGLNIKHKQKYPAVQWKDLSSVSFRTLSAV